MKRDFLLSSLQVILSVPIFHGIILFQICKMQVLLCVCQKLTPVTCHSQERLEQNFLIWLAREVLYLAVTFIR